MRIYTTFDTANAALTESGGWIVQTAESEYWHCPYIDGFINILSQATNTNRVIVHRFMLLCDRRGEFVIDARECDFSDCEYP